ncbi:MAG: hypothetical protein AABX51_02800 [Nanoarchaeota archaeon]
MNWQDITNPYVIIAIVGLIVTFIATITRNSIYHKKIFFSPSNNFLIYFVINSVTYAIVSWALNRKPIGDQWLNILIIGLSIAFIGKILVTGGHFEGFSVFGMPWWVLLIIGIIGYAIITQSSTQNLFADISKNTELPSNSNKLTPSNPFDLFSNIFSKSPLSQIGKNNGCPQLGTLLIGERGYGIIRSDSSKEINYRCPQNIDGYNDCIIFTGKNDIEFSVSYFSNQTWTSPYEIVLCRKGKLAGENRNNFYCDQQAPSINSLYNLDNLNTLFNNDIPYIVKIPVSQGEIIKNENIIRKSFVNVYDSNRQFVETKCGEDPEVLYARRSEKAKEEFKAFARELESWSP